jgi:hypothetical protein
MPICECHVVEPATVKQALTLSRNVHPVKKLSFAIEAMSFP